MVLLIANELDLLVELLGLGETLDDLGFTVLADKLCVLRQFDREGGPQDEYRADGKL